MAETKTVAERLRESAEKYGCTALCRMVLYAINGEDTCPPTPCTKCKKGMIKTLASQIEAEQAHAVSKALKGAKPQLPEGVIWPRFEDGELVKPFDKLPGFDSEGVQKFIWTSSNNGAWQLQDAEGHMLNVMHGKHVKRPGPDTFKSILSEMVSAIECEDCVDLDPYIERFRKLMGGE